MSAPAAPVAFDRLGKLRSARLAARSLRASPAATRNRVLYRLAGLLGEKQADILAANAADLAALAPAPGASAEESGRYTPAFQDRLMLDAKRISHMAESLKQVASLPDPVGELVDEHPFDNGLQVRRVRSPLGVILMIFESRPNVATEAFSLAFKAGNVILLRGGRESMRTTAVLYAAANQAIRECGLPEDCLIGINDPDRDLTDWLLEQNTMIDVVVPRGGDRLIEYVTRHSRIPVIKNDRGMCHVYAHEDADLAMALNIVDNAKTQRPGVCNAMETLLVHRSIASRLLADLARRIPQVRFHACPESLPLLAAAGAGVQVEPAGDRSFDTEYLDLDLNVRVVGSLDEAIAHVERHGSRHSESILTASPESARRWQQEIDAAVVYWNASTRFTDGFELGLGGELGVSTQKLHVRGPVGLRELTSVRWIIEGSGQVRD